MSVCRSLSVCRHQLKGKTTEMTVSVILCLSVGLAVSVGVSAEGGNNGNDRVILCLSVGLSVSVEVC